MQTKMSRGKLLDERGALYEAGYAKSLVKEYDRRAIKGGVTRIKEWDYYLIYNDDYAIALTIADNSYMGLISATLIDFKKPFEKTKSIMTLLPMGKTKFPSSSVNGDVNYVNKNVTAEFLNDGTIRKLKMNIKKFDKDSPVNIYLELTDAPKDSMVIATPFSEKDTAFYYNQKIIGMKAEGKVEFSGNTYEFSLENSKGLLDWGRGVWTYDNTWYWGAGQGKVEGKDFGFNIGYGFGDTSQASENMLFFEGIAHKLEQVSFNIPKLSNGKDDYMNPWTFTSSDGRFEMEFTPIIDREVYTSLGIILSDQHQVFGYLDGKAILDDGKEIILNKFLGFAEKVRNKW